MTSFFITTNVSNLIVSPFLKILQMNCSFHILTIYFKKFLKNLIISIQINKNPLQVTRNNFISVLTLIK